MFPPEAIPLNSLKMQELASAVVETQLRPYATPRNDETAGNLAAVKINSQGFSVYNYRGRRQPAYCHNDFCKRNAK
jgi:hypothetical protein